MRTLLFFILMLLSPFLTEVSFSSLSASDPKFEEQEAFLPHSPGMSEFFYYFNDEKHVTRIGPSVDSHWTPSEENVANLRVVQYVGMISVGMSNHLYAISITGGSTGYQMPKGLGYGYGKVFETGKDVTWTKAGNRWVEIRSGLYVDLETAQLIYALDTKGIRPIRSLERTW